VREQIIEDAASASRWQFECDDGRCAWCWPARPLALGNREILFDDQGREAAPARWWASFRRPNWLKSV